VVPSWWTVDGRVSVSQTGRRPAHECDDDMDDTRWDAFARGVECPLDAPRPESTEHWDFVAALSVSSLYLVKNQTYRGHCQLIFDVRHVSRLDQLTADEWARLSTDLFAAQRAIARTVRPDHMNIESLGNVVPHLHWHIVPRYRQDPRWGSPIWLTSLADMIETSLAEDEREGLIQALRSSLGM
jgi:diadenosine tetraphosphate (Ap4A) HIT family hydrolase